MSSSQPSQFVLVGGIWVAPQYTAAASSGREPDVSAATIYGSMASPSVASTMRSPAKTRKAKADSQHKSPVRALPSDKNTERN